MSIQITFQIHLSADYHVASGHGRGARVDSSLLRDWDTTPVVRGTELVGLLRDGFLDLCEMPAASQSPALQAGKVAVEQRLFGDVQHPKNWYFSSAAPKQRKINQPINNWGAQDVTRVQINPLMRRTDPQKLFIEEEGDGRLVFQFTATSPTNSDRDIADAAALVAAARMVRAIGSARRRGRGACAITVVEAEGLGNPPSGQDWTDHLLDIFQEKWLDPENQRTYPGQESTDDVAMLVIAGDPVRLRVLVYLQEPTLIARRSQAANVFETLDLIPGGALLGSLANYAAARSGLDGAEANARFVQMFVRGRIRATNLLPAEIHRDRDGDALLFSVPSSKAVLECSLHPTRHKTVMVLDEQNPTENCSDSSCSAKLEALSGMRVWSGSGWQRFVPRFRDEMHIRINRKTGRVETGMLFGYNCLEAGQIFAGELTCASKDIWQALQQLLPPGEETPNNGLLFEMRLGKASRRGYGCARIMLQEMTSEIRSPFEALPIEFRLRDFNTPIDIFLVSDTIVMDPWGRFYSSFSETWLAKALDLQPSDLHIVRQKVATREIDGFNGHRRMPRWRDVALAAGSTARIQLHQSALATLNGSEEADKFRSLTERLSALERSGIGLRQHEGFGSIVFNHPSLYNAPQVRQAMSENYLPTDIPEGLLANGEIHQLFNEKAIYEDWRKKIISHRDKTQGWKAVQKYGEVIARLLYISRHAPLDEVMERVQQLRKGVRPLFGVDVSHGEKQPKMPENVVTFLQTVIDELKKQPADFHSQGLKLLAEMIAEDADRTELIKGAHDANA